MENFSKKQHEVNNMKKTKLLTVVALVLVAVFALSSCASTVKDLSKIYNASYEFKDTSYKSISEIGFADYEVVNSNGAFVVFETQEETKKGDVYNVIAIYSLLSEQVVKEIEYAEDEYVYDISFCDSIPVVAITSTTIPDVDVEEEVVEEAEVTKTYIDAKGNELLTIDPACEIGAPKWISDDLVVINQVLYTVNEKTGALKKDKSIPAYVSVDDMFKMGEYYYSGGEGAVVIYDNSFVPVASYVLPSYANTVSEAVFNDGSILIQYMVDLPEEAVFFDLYVDGVKNNLFSKLIKVDGKVKDLDLDYIVQDSTPNFDLYDEAKAKDCEFTGEFENIAFISRIEDKRVDTNSDNWEAVLMDNNAKVKKSLMIVDGQTDIPEMFAKDLYLVDTVYGKAVVDNEGAVLFQVTNDDLSYGAAYGYIIGETAIYDTKFKVAYDLLANDAEILTVINETIFIKAGDDENYSIITLCGGKKTDVFTYDAEEDVTFEITAYGYVIHEMGEDKKGNVYSNYSYYNEEGTLLIETESALSIVAAGEDKIIVSMFEDDGDEMVKVYYVIKK